MSAIATQRRRVTSALMPGPHLRHRVAVLLAVAVALTAGYFLWFRDSGLVAVDEVTVTGASGRDAERIRDALEAAGRDMTTLHVDEAKLHEAVRAFPVVRDLRIETNFPSGLKITVIEHVPAAFLAAGGKRIPVAGDGTVLEGLPAKDLPIIKAPRMPADRVPAGRLRAAAAVAGGAPTALRGELEEVVTQPDRGIVVLMEDGPDLVFGDARHVAAKWAAVARVLADEGAAGAEYIDVRIAGRVAAGGLSVETVLPSAPAADPAAATGTAGQQEPQTAPEANQQAAPQTSVPAQPQTEPTTPAVPPQTQPQAQPQSAPAPTPQAPAATGGGAVANP